MHAIRSIDSAVIHLWTAVFIGLATGLIGCSKPKQEAEAPPAQVESVSNHASARVSPVMPQTPTPGLVISNAALATSVVASAAAVVSPEKVAQVAALETKYAATQGFDDRFDVLLEIGKAGGPEAILALERLFRVEPESELRTELINALIDIGGGKEEKFAFLKLGVAADQAPAVREAAIDGLVDLEDARALPILQELTHDPNEQVNAAAKNAHQVLGDLLK